MSKKVNWLEEAKGIIDEFHNTKYGKMTQEQMNKSYAGSISRSVKTNEEERLTKLKEGVNNSEAHARTRVENVSKTWNCKKRTAAAAESSKELVTCPHCGKEGKKSGMKSWHFDRCKQNPDRKPRDSKHESRR